MLIKGKGLRHRIDWNKTCSTLVFFIHLFIYSFFHKTIDVLLNDSSRFICIENDLSLTICCKGLKSTSISTKQQR